MGTDRLKLRLPILAAACWAAAGLALLLPGPAAAATPLARLVKVGTFSAPVQVVQPPGTATTLWVLQKRGQIAVMVGGKLKPAKALDIGSQVSMQAEQGLLGLAFAPDYAASHRAYVTYTDRSNNLVLAEYRGNNTALDPATKRVVINIAKPEADHNGGTIRFGADGYLHLGTGDGGGAGDRHGTIGNAQDLTSLLGKILRIDPRASGDLPYSVPADNPFAGPLHAVAGERPEIWAYGLRNPWKWSFAPDGAIWIGDVGQDTTEEIDRVAVPGANLGWRNVEGTRIRAGEIKPTGMHEPILTYPHGSTTGCAVIGGVVVNDSTVPKLKGKYIYGDFCHSTLQWISSTGAALTAKGSTSIKISGAVVSIDTDLSGRVYVSSLTGGVWRLSK